MKNQSRLSLLLAFCYIFFIITACVDETTPTRLPVNPTKEPTSKPVTVTPTVQLELSLSGMWRVNEISFDQTIKRTFIVEIEHEGKELQILKDGDEVVSCTVNEEKLDCTNWEAYGFNTIYIENSTSMYSELPLVESVNKLDFIKLD
ncbi:MAG: hypothetical protein V2I36_01785 [Desulfopila sp.]|nr:hypothetical protein [Desulfopila sp.]